MDVAQCCQDPRLHMDSMCHLWDRFTMAQQEKDMAIQAEIARYVSCKHTGEHISDVHTVTVILICCRLLLLPRLEAWWFKIFQKYVPHFHIPIRIIILVKLTFIYPQMISFSLIKMCFLFIAKFEGNFRK